MMLMPTGPPAMKLTSLADVNGSSEQEKMSIAKFLTVSIYLFESFMEASKLCFGKLIDAFWQLSYAISPLICFAVVGSLKAVQAAMGSS